VDEHDAGPFDEVDQVGDAEESQPKPEEDEELEAKRRLLLMLKTG